jgi:glycosyltransferase involved in cell wall biosynthesis
MTLSLCIPCFNGESTIRETFCSVADQTVSPHEFLVADNGSSDGSREVIESLIRMHPAAAAIVHRFEKPLGMAADWNRLVRMATGDIVILLACDDVLEPLAVEAHLNAFRRMDVALSCSPKRLVTSRNRTFPICMRRLPSGYFPREEVLRLAVPRADNIIGEPSGVAFRRRDFFDVGGFDERLKYFPDLDLWFRLLSCGNIFVSRDPLYRFRVHAGSLTSANQQMALKEWEIVYRRFALIAGLNAAPSVSARTRARMTLLLRRIVLALLHLF